jgi:nucleosome-remodeling factor subunit BPTF
VICTNPVICHIANNDTSLPSMRITEFSFLLGTYMFKLGMENAFKSYVNQYSTNVAALNRLQRNEERDKKRHLSHKFSLTQASEFKWIGSLYGKHSFCKAGIISVI